MKLELKLKHHTAVVHPKAEDDRNCDAQSNGLFIGIERNSMVEWHPNGTMVDNG